MLTRVRIAPLRSVLNCKSDYCLFSITLSIIYACTWCRFSEHMQLFHPDSGGKVKDIMDTLGHVPIGQAVLPPSDAPG